MVEVWLLVCNYIQITVSKSVSIHIHNHLSVMSSGLQSRSR